MPSKPHNLARTSRWLLRHAGRRWHGLLAVVGTTLLGTGLSVLKPWPMKVLLDHVLEGRPLSPAAADLFAHLPGAAGREGVLGWCVIATVILFVLGWLVTLVGSFANIAFGQAMIYDVAMDLYGHLLRLSPRYHTRHGVGDSIRRIVTDSHSVSTIINGAILPIFSSVVTLGAMIALMWHLDRQLTLLSMAVLPFMVLILRRYAGPMEQRSYEQQEVEGRLYDRVEQTLGGVMAVQAFAREEHEERQFRRVAGDTLAATVAMTRIDLQFKILTGLVLATGTAGIMWVGAAHVLDGRLTLGTILVFLSYLSSLYGPLESLMYTSSTFQSASGSVRRVVEVLDAMPEVIERPTAPRAAAAAATPAETPAETRGHVRLEDVRFEYEPGRPVLRGVDLDVRAGETVALVGSTGAGKSTLALLLPRLLDATGGRVLLDGADVRDWPLAELRRSVALAPQEPLLFSVAVADNVGYGSPTATAQQVVHATRAARAEEFVRRLPQGYETVVGERGATLSGGERQRLSVARALLLDAPVLVLDEPTAALDADTEDGLITGVLARRRGKTTFLIAHRLSTARRADRIVVLQDGRVVEQGSHEQLMEARGAYRKLHDASTSADQPADGGGA